MDTAISFSTFAVLILNGFMCYKSYSQARRNRCMMMTLLEVSICIADPLRGEFAYEADSPRRESAMECECLTVKYLNSHSKMVTDMRYSLQRAWYERQNRIFE